MPKAKTATFHKSNLGRFGANLPCDSQGYVTYSEKEYDRAHDEMCQGEPMPEGLPRLKRNAWLVAQAERQLEAWRAGGDI